MLRGAVSEVDFHLSEPYPAGVCADESTCVKTLIGFQDEFLAYYPASDEARRLAYSEGLIVLDTNALLDLYRLSASARNEFLAVLENVKDRLFVPYQVALEFHRRRIDALTGRIREFEAQRTNVEDHVSKLKDVVTTTGQRGRVDHSQVEDALQRVEQVRERLLAFIEDVAKEHGLDPNAIVRETSDEIVGALSTILHGRVNQRPDDEQLEKDRTEGLRRVDAKIPPGFSDANKGDDGANDYMWWAEAVRHASEVKPVAILILSNDVAKGDWTLDVRGTRIGLHPFLTDEIASASGAVVVHATTHEFLSEAATRLSVNVSSDTVLEAKDLRLVPIEEVVQALRKALGTSLRPMRGATLSGIALRIDPTLKSREWNGAGTFRQFVAKQLPGVEFDPLPTPGLFYIPGVHDIGNGEDSDLPENE